MFYTQKLCSSWVMGYNLTFLKLCLFTFFVSSFLSSGYEGLIEKGEKSESDHPFSQLDTHCVPGYQGLEQHALSLAI